MNQYKIFIWSHNSYSISNLSWNLKDLSIFQTNSTMALFNLVHPQCHTRTRVLVNRKSKTFTVEENLLWSLINHTTKCHLDMTHNVWVHHDITNFMLESKDLVTEYDKGYSWHSYGVWLRITHQRSSYTRDIISADPYTSPEQVFLQVE